MKHLFRKHIWKQESEEFLRKEVYYGWTYYYYVIRETCVLCKKTRVYERRKLSFQ